MIKVLFLLLLCGFSVFNGTALADRTLVLSGPPWEPFLNEKNPEEGLATEIVVQAMAKAGYQTSVRITPWRRVLAEAKNGNIDVLVGLWFSEERAEIFSFSEPYYDNQIHFIARKESPFVYQGLGSLGNLRIGVRMGANFGKAFDEADYLNKVPVPNDMSMLQMLARGRLDLGVGDKLILQQLMTSEAALADSIEWIDPPMNTLPLHMAVVRTIPDHAEIVERFNSALSQMKHSGELSRIYQRYGID